MNLITISNFTYFRLYASQCVIKYFDCVVLYVAFIVFLVCRCSFKFSDGIFLTVFCVVWPRFLIVFYNELNSIFCYELFLDKDWGSHSFHPQNTPLVASVTRKFRDTGEAPIRVQVLRMYHRVWTYREAQKIGTLLYAL